MIDLTLPAGSAPTIQPYSRATGLAVGSPISGSAVGGRPTLFRFDISALDDGDYVMDLASPAGRFLVRKSATEELIADEWWELDYLQVSETGQGARLVSITVLLGGTALQGAKVRLTKGPETYLGETNSSGLVTFNVNDGTWAVAITAPGAYFNGASLVVDGAETVSYSMTANPSIVASDPDKVTGYWLCLSHFGMVESGVSVTLQLVDKPLGSLGLALDGAVRTATSGPDGVVSFANLIPGARYKVTRGTTSKDQYFTAPDSSSEPVPLGTIVGSE